ncbi:hypothetical protein Z517_09196 [Fonsecaea pedrosoi CBS 271.37]|uniref:Uncharacterized protein n=1 Tax=Fonsecaea pedrosoi CBS 271.37 TaxID=1442368 RepID=A0A0D2ER63_9EURO|nr:uncharacterized protein Z517_09196 [Fonsecaea pedrosoi CBS 271.37]KIW76752.1 hypothetical protein Z517_09196 [Fonsecaea pedrosoi CBS 271.37]
MEVSRRYQNSARYWPHSGNKNLSAQGYANALKLVLGIKRQKSPNKPLLMRVDQWGGPASRGREFGEISKDFKVYSSEGFCVVAVEYMGNDGASVYNKIFLDSGSQLDMFCWDGYEFDLMNWTTTSFESIGNASRVTALPFSFKVAVPSLAFVDYPAPGYNVLWGEVRQGVSRRLQQKQSIYTQSLGARRGGHISGDFGSQPPCQYPANAR